MSFDARKKLGRNEPLASRFMEGVPDQEPWVGYGVCRTQFLIDIRNHILLKWAQCQSGDAALQGVEPAGAPAVQAVAEAAGA